MKPIFNLLKYTWRYSKGNRHMVILFVVLSLVANGLQLLQPYFVSRAFDAAQFTPNDPRILQQVVQNFVYIILISLGFWALHGPSRVIELRNAFLVRKKYRQEMFEKVLALPTDWHKDHHSGDTIDIVGKASESIFLFSSYVFLITTNAVRLFGGVVALLFFYKTGSMIALATAIMVFMMIMKFDKVLRVGYLKIFRAENSLASAIHDYISNVLTIITLRLRPRVTNEIERRSMVAFEPFRRNNVLGETKWYLSSFAIAVMIASVLILYAHQSYVATGVIAVGTLFALFQYLSSIGNTFFDFAMRYSEFVKYEAALQAAEVINQEHSKLVQKDNSYLPLRWGEIEIKGLRFSYDKNSSDKYHLDNINLTIKKGNRVAFIGESGSGKSTTLSLLRGLYHSDAEVYVDGEKMVSGMEHLHEHITLVPQDPEIFNSTVEDNITMETQVKPEELSEAIRLARFESVITRLPNGLKTNVMEKGVSLSGGEKQRLALARGILAAKDSEFLFMDEPTSSVDTGNEMEIYRNIFAKFDDKTIISSIHRLHLLKLFDYIYFFKDGRIQAEGALSQLMEHREFKQLWDTYSKTLTQE